MLLSNSTQFLFLYFVYMYTLQFTTETNSPLRNLPFLILLRSCPRSPPMRSTMAQSLTTLGDGTDWDKINSTNIIIIISSRPKLLLKILQWSLYTQFLSM